MISTLGILPLDEVWRGTFENFYRDMSSLTKVDPSGTAQYVENDRMVYAFNMAGFNKNDIEVKLLKDDKLLKIYGLAAQHPNREYVYNSLAPKERKFTIGLFDLKDFDMSTARVEFNEGVLTVSFPKLNKRDRTESEINLEIS